MKTNFSIEFELILEDCLDRISKGESLESCLEKYPEQSAHLKELLILAGNIHQLPIPAARPSAVASGKQKMLAELQAVQQPQPVSSFNFSRYIKQTISFLLGKEDFQMKPILRPIIALLLVCVIGGTLAVNVSARSIPGDSMYSFKRTWENLRLAFTISEKTRTVLEEQLKLERHQEIQTLIENHQKAVLQYTGVLRAMKAHQWLVDDLWVKIEDRLIIEGHPKVGDLVEITIETEEDGMLILIKISVVESAVEIIPGEAEPGDEGWPEDPSVWVTPIPYWETYQPNEWRTLVPTEYQTLVPTDLMLTIVPTQYQTYIPEDLNTIPTLVQTLIPTWVPPVNATNWPTLIPPTWPTDAPLPQPTQLPPVIQTLVPPDIQTMIPPDWPDIDPEDYTTEIPEFIETMILPPNWP